MAIHKKALSRYRATQQQRQFSTATVLDDAGANDLLRQRIERRAPLMVSRFSTCEMNVLNVFRQRQRAPMARKIASLLTNVPGEYTDKIRFQAHNNAGIFPETDAGLDAFAARTYSACAHIDILGIWSNPLRLEETLQRERCPHATLIPLSSIDPYTQENPWTAALAGKRVLVVHPFEESIRSQYQRRELLFPGKDILPEFDLQTVKAVQSAAGATVPYTQWIDALASMTERIASLEYDVALIGAGAYGLPLASFVKTQGKQAIHMGGMLQLLFGIKGARWDERAAELNLYNEHWTRPLRTETPKQSGRVEEGCYW